MATEAIKTDQELDEQLVPTGGTLLTRPKSKNASRNNPFASRELSSRSRTHEPTPTGSTSF